MEKDPNTGIINFDSKPALSNVEEDDFLEYEENSSKSDTFNKNNIDRKDTVGTHKNSDVNQLVPNFHDFLNLPVKYNSDKYVYPLISSSYANTKVQGNVNKHQNHKNYAHLVTQKPLKGTTTSYYYTTEASSQPITPVNTDSFPSNEFEDYSYEEYDYTTRANANNIYLTTTKPATTTTTEAATTTTTTTTTTRPKTTKKTMSLWQQLLGDYEETETETVPSSHHSLLDSGHLPNMTVAPQNVNVGGSYYEYQYEDDIPDADTQQVVSNVGMNTTIEPTTSTTAATITSSSHNHYVSSETITEKTTKTTTSKTSPIYPRQPTPSSQSEAYQTAPSTTIHIPAHQNTVSFLVGNHQKVEGEYVGTVIEENIQTNDNKRIAESHKHLSGNSVNIQPFKHPEASLTIGMPVDRVKGIPGQVVDEKLHPANEEYGKHKVVFPVENQPGELL